MLKINKEVKRNRILFGIGVFLVILVTVVLLNGGLTNIYKPDNDIDEEVNINESEFDSNYIVAIDAGHGGNDPGTSGYGLLEKDINLDISLKLEKILKQSGIKTFMIRNGDEYMDRIDRIELANSKKVTLYMSIHCDWFEDKSFNGIRTFYNPLGELKVGNLTEQDFAQTIQNSLIEKLKAKDMGIVGDTQISVVKRAEMPSVLVEIGFLSNKKDSELLSSDSYRKKCAEALAEGIKLSLKSIK